MASGLVVQSGPDVTARDLELRFESEAMRHNLVKYESQHVFTDQFTFAEDPVVFLLRDPSDAEQVYFANTSNDSMTKMGLARKLEILHGLQRVDAWKHMSKASPPYTGGRGSPPTILGLAIYQVPK